MSDDREYLIKQIVGSIRRVTRAVYLDSKKMVKQFGLSGPQSLVLKAISARGPVSSAELSRILLVTSANMTGHIDRLEKKDLVNRVKKEGDRRVSLIELTVEGVRLSQSIPDPIEEKLILGLKDLRATEIFGIFSAIEQVVNLIDAQEVVDAPLDPDPKTWPDEDRNGENDKK